MIAVNVLMDILLAILLVGITAMLVLIIMAKNENRAAVKSHSCKNTGADEWDERKIFAIPYNAIGF